MPITSVVDPELKRLMLANKSASLPTEADSARVFEALRARLGDGAITQAADAPNSATSNSERASKPFVTHLARLSLQDERTDGSSAGRRSCG